MNYITEFIPQGGRPKLSKMWRMFGIVLFLFSIPDWVIPMELIFHIAGQVFTFLLMLVTMLPYRETVSITVSKFDSTLKHITLGCFGREHLTIISLADARILYKYKSVSRNEKGWCLLLCNNYLLNRVTVTEDEKGGFSKVQLDEIFSMANELKTVSRSNRRFSKIPAWLLGF